MMLGKALGNGYAITAVLGKKKLWKVLKKLLSAVLFDRKNWLCCSPKNFRNNGTNKKLGIYN